MTRIYTQYQPLIFSFNIGSAEISLSWYAFAYASAFYWVWLWSRYFASRQRFWQDDISPISRNQVDGARIWIFGGAILGARVTYVLFYNADFFSKNLMEVVKVWHGGMSFHGGAIGVVIAAAIYAWKQKIPLFSGLDLIALSIPYGLFMGRIANFFNGELWGRPSRVPWAMVFPGTDAQTCPLGWVDPCTRHPSQLYEAALEGLALGILLIILTFRYGLLKSPGAISSVFLVGYGLARFLMEYFRQPDAQFRTIENPMGFFVWFGSGEYQVGLSMGQILSIPMILGGIVIYFVIGYNSNHTQN